MSYSFSFRAADKAAAVATLASKFDEVVASQLVHAKDRDVAIASATAIISLCSEPDDGQELVVSVSGWVQWTQAVVPGAVPDTLSGANITVSVYPALKAD